MIVFDELQFAEDIIRNGYRNKKYISYENVILVKYWRHKGLNEAEIRNKLKQMMSDFEYLYNSNILEYKINKAIREGYKYDLSTGVEVEITDKEIELINTIPYLPLRKIAFVLLVVWKFRGKPKKFVIKKSDVLNLTKLKINGSKYLEYMHELVRLGLISCAVYRANNKYKNYYHLHIPEDIGGNVLFTIKHFDNLIYYYLRIDDPNGYSNCEECGKIIKLTSNRRIYCRECWITHRRKYKARKQREYRNNVDN